jgi:hypothetical protein
MLSAFHDSAWTAPDTQVREASLDLIKQSARSSEYGLVIHLTDILDNPNGEPRQSTPRTHLEGCSVIIKDGPESQIQYANFAKLSAMLRYTMTSDSFLTEQISLQAEAENIRSESGATCAEQTSIDQICLTRQSTSDAT